MIESVDVEATVHLTFAVTFSNYKDADDASVAEALTDYLADWIADGNQVTPDMVTIHNREALV